MRLSRGLVLGVAAGMAAGSALAARAPIENLAREPYAGAVVIDAADGAVLVEDGADNKAYPASVVKLMDLLLVLESIESGALKLTDAVTVSAEVSKMGGSQVYLKENETIAVDDLVYALIVQSANDAAAALAERVAGTRTAFVERMNRRAAELGMASTQFHSVHGLPPGAGQQPDVSTPRDIALLCRELLKHPDCLRYTATREKTFRPDAKEPFIMRTHNHLLAGCEGCDGFKTGYFRAAGYSIAATAQRNGVRLIAVVMGGTTRPTRDSAAQDLLARGFAKAAERAAAKAKPNA